MADTQRSLATLKALLADNVAGDISPQDVRDFLESIRRGHAQLYITASAVTTLADTVTFVPVAGTWDTAGPIFNWTDNGDGRLKYVGAADRVVRVVASLSLTPAANNKVFEVIATLNGAEITGSRQRTKLGSGGDVQTITPIAYATIEPNDLIGLSVRNISDASDVTAVLGNLTVVSSIN
jgi:hypothetical protein